MFPASAAGSLETPLRRLVKSPRRLAALTGTGPSARILELGPGPGYFSVELAHRVPSGHLALCDLQPAMLERARRKLEVPAVSFVAADALALPYPAGCFDAAVVVTVLGEVPDRRGCVRELHRVLRPGGRLLIAETVGDPDFQRLSHVRELCGSVGFGFVHRQGWFLNYTAVFRRDGGRA